MRLTTKKTTARNFTIARATVDDSEAILRCLRAAFEPYRTQYTPAAYEDTVLTADTVRERIHTMIVLVARTEVGVIRPSLPLRIPTRLAACLVVPSKAEGI